jgi:hypothetical protein
MENPVDFGNWKWSPPTAYMDREKRKRESLRWQLSSALPEWMVNWDQTPQPPTISELIPKVLLETKVGETLKLALEEIRGSDTCETRNRLLENLPEKLRQHCILGLASDSEIYEAIETVSLALEQNRSDSGTQISVLIDVYTNITIGICSSKVLTPGDYPVALWTFMLIRMSKLPISKEICSLFSELVKALPRHYLVDMKDGLVSMMRAFFTEWSREDIWNIEIVQSHLKAAEELSMIIPNQRPLLKGGIMRMCKNSENAGRNKRMLKGRLRTARSALAKFEEEIKTVSKIISPQEHHEKYFVLALAMMSSNDHGDILQAVTGIILMDFSSLRNFESIWCSWLRILSQMPQVDQKALLDIYRQAPISLRSANDTVLLSQLLINHWTSHGNLEDPDRLQRSFNEHVGFRDSDVSIAWLITSLCRTQPPDKRKVALESLCEALKAINRPREALHSFSVLCARLTKFRELPLKSIAVVSNDHELALDLYHLTRKYWRKLSPNEPAEERWDWSAWRQYVERMILDPSIPLHHIWGVLGIRMYEYASKNQGIRRKGRSGFAEDKVQLVDDMAGWFLRAPRVSNRMALRHVSQCIRYLEEHNVRLSSQVLLALTQIITEDLAVGKPGRTQRLRWLLSVICKHSGVEAAEMVRKRLQLWRQNVVSGSSR